MTSFNVHFDFDSVRAKSPDGCRVSLTGIWMQIGQTVGDAAAARNQWTANAGAVRVHVTEGDLLISHAPFGAVAVVDLTVGVQQVFGVCAQRLGCDIFHLAQHLAAGFDDRVPAHEGELGSNSVPVVWISAGVDLG